MGETFLGGIAPLRPLVTGLFTGKDVYKNASHKCPKVNKYIFSSINKGLKCRFEKLYASVLICLNK